MILRIFIGSETLDVQSNVSFSLVKTNAVFDFDNFIYTRSTSFSLRRTPRNERILKASGNTHTQGVYMRTKTRCIVEIDSVQAVGYLYITAATDEQYECQLLIGEFVDSPFEKTIKQILNAADYSDIVYYGDDYVQNANGAHSKDYIAPIRYYSGKSPAISTAKSKPSVYAKKLLDAVIPNDLDDVECRFVVKPTDETDLQGKDIKLFFGNNGSVYFGGDDKDSAGEFFEIVKPYGDTPYLTGVDVALSSNVNETKHVLEYFRAKKTVYLSAETEWAYIYTGLRYITDYSVSTSSSGIRYILYAVVNAADEWLNGEVKFHIDSSMKPYFYTDEEATDVLIPAGTVFRATRLSDNYPNQSETPDTLGQFSVLGGRYGGAAFYVQPASRLLTTQWDCIPDMKISDFVRSYARLAGALIYYDGKTIKQVSDMAFGGYLKDVVKRGKMERKFSNFTQKTIIQYADSEIGEAIYIVANDYISEETKKTLPVSVGGRYSSYPNALYIEELGDNVYVGKIGDSSDMTRKYLPKNTALSLLCAQSTLLRLSVRMTYAQFNTLQFNALFSYDNSEWVWTQATWQNNTCELLLQLYR